MNFFKCDRLPALRRHCRDRGSGGAAPEPHECRLRRPGYARDQARYDKNNRPKELRVSFSDSTAYNCYFDDVNEEQTIRFDGTIATRYVEIEIRDVYKGREDDTCIFQVRAFYVY